MLNWRIYVRDLADQLPSLRGPLTPLMERNCNTLRFREVCNRLAGWEHGMENQMRQLEKPDPILSHLQDENRKLANDLHWANLEVRLLTDTSNYDANQTRKAEGEVTKLRSELSRQGDELAIMKRDAGELVARLREERLDHTSQLREIRGDLYDARSIRRRREVSPLGRGRTRSRSPSPIGHHKWLYRDMRDDRAEKRRWYSSAYQRARSPSRSWRSRPSASNREDLLERRYARR